MKELTFLAIGIVIGTVVTKCRQRSRDLAAEVEALRRKNAN